MIMYVSIYLYTCVYIQTPLHTYMYAYGWTDRQTDTM